MDIQETRFYRLSEVSTLTGIPHSTLNTYARQGKIRAAKMGKIWRMNGESVKKLLEYGTEEPKQERKG